MLGLLSAPSFSFKKLEKSISPHFFKFLEFMDGDGFFTITILHMIIMFRKITDTRMKFSSQAVVSLLVSLTQTTIPFQVH